MLTFDAETTHGPVTLPYAAWIARLGFIGAVTMYSIILMTMTAWVQDLQKKPYH